MWIYFVIFFAKLVEVSISTLRNVLINRGEKVKGAFLGFFEVLIWLLVVSNVLSTITEDPVKVIVYCLAFAIGNYIGVSLENKLALGISLIQAVVGEDIAEELSRELRAKGFGVTIVQGQGMENTVAVMMIYLKRKCVVEAVDLINAQCPQAMVTVNDVRQVRNGFMRQKGR